MKDFNSKQTYSDHASAAEAFVNQLLEFGYEDNQVASYSFWFYGEDEASMYRLAASLQHESFHIEQLQFTDHNDWLCIAEKKIPTTTEVIMKLGDHLDALAEKHNCIFDGWETELEGGIHVDNPEDMF